MRDEEGVTVFVPVFNEEGLLETNTLRLRALLASLELPYEIILGSNGSVDGTVPMGERLSRRYGEIRFFHLTRKGVGSAFKKGVTMARYGRIVTMDMDLSVHMKFIPEACRLLESYDVVIGSKITGSQNRPRIRRLASTAFIRLAGVLLRIHFHDYSIAAKGYRKALIEEYLPLLNDKTFYVVEILYRARHDGMRLKEIPVQCSDMRESRFNLAHEGIHKFGHLFGLWLRNGIERTPRPSGDP